MWKPFYFHIWLDSICVWPQTWWDIPLFVLGFLLSLSRCSSVWIMLGSFSHCWALLERGHCLSLSIIFQHCRAWLFLHSFICMHVDASVPWLCHQFRGSAISSVALPSVPWLCCQFSDSVPVPWLHVSSMALPSVLWLRVSSMALCQFRDSVSVPWLCVSSVALCQFCGSAVSSMALCQFCGYADQPPMLSMGESVFFHSPLKTTHLLPFHQLQFFISARAGLRIGVVGAPSCAGWYL